MITRQFNALRAAKDMRSHGGGFDSSVDNYTFKDYSGNTKTIRDLITSNNVGCGYWCSAFPGTWQTEHNFVEDLSQISGGGLIVFGSGSTAPSPNDYKLDHEETQNFNYRFQDYPGAMSNTDGLFSRQIKYIITNNSNAPITIREYGLTTGFSRNGFNNPVWGSGYLVFRDLLQNPVTINSNRSALLTVTYKFDTDM